MKLNPAQIDILRENGWQTNGNNIHRLAGVEILPAGPGAWEPAVFGQSIRMLPNGFVILHTKPENHRPDGTCDFVHEVILCTPRVADVLAWLHANGKQSDGGQPAGSCGVWD